MSNEVIYFHVITCCMDDPQRRDDWQIWYDTIHVPAMLAVPGVRSVTRYAELGSSSSFLAMWEIDGPAVLESEEYAAVRGFGPWAPYMGETRVWLLERHRPECWIPAAQASTPQ
jgi:hypothetical protein